MYLRPIEHLENHRPKCKMHTQERQLTLFLYFTTDLQRKPNQTNGFSRPNRNRTEFEKSILHIPNNSDIITVMFSQAQTGRCYLW